MFSFTTALLASLIINFITIVIAYMLSRGPQIYGKEPLLLNKLNTISYLALLFAVIYSVVTMHRPSIWVYLYTIFVGSSVFYILLSSSSMKRLRFYILSLPLLVMATSLAINGPAPLTSDEGRFTGFALRIVKDEKWIPFQYSEHIYYQLFHVIPFLKAILFLITGADIIYVVHPLLVLLLTFITTLAIYTLTHRILSTANGDQRSLNLATLSPILFLCTPTVSTIGFIPQWLSVSLYLLAFLTLLILPPRKANLVLLLLLSLTGVIVHAAYPILMLVSLGALMLSKALKGINVSRLFGLIMAVTLMYWTFTAIMNYIIGYGGSFLNTFIEIASSGLMERMSSVQAIYSAAPAWIAYPWALLPSFTSSMIFLKLTAKILKNRMVNGLELFTIILGIFGLMFLALGFISRMFNPFHVSTVRYLYAVYYLLLPASIYIINEIFSRKRAVGISVVASIITASAFFAIQDPAFSPDIYRITTNADKRSWAVAEIIAPLLSPSIGYRFDTRVSIGVATLTLERYPEMYTGRIKYVNFNVAFVNLDIVGRMNLVFWFGSEFAKLIENHNCSIIFSDGSYKAYMRP